MEISPGNASTQDPLRKSLRPSVRGLTVRSLGESLKEKIVETIEKGIGQPLLPRHNIKPSELRGVWKSMVPLHPKWEARYHYRWVLPPGFKFPKEIVSRLDPNQINHVMRYLESGELRVEKLEYIPPQPPEVVSDPQSFNQLVHEEYKVCVHTILCRCLVAILTQFPPDVYGYAKCWPIKPMITGKGEGGFPGYKWRFSTRDNPFPEFPLNKSYLASWTNESLRSFLLAFKEGSICLEKEEGYIPPRFLESFEHGISDSVYSYVDTHEIDYQDAVLIENEKGTIGDETYTLNDLFGCREPVVQPSTPVEKSPALSQTAFDPSRDSSYLEGARSLNTESAIPSPSVSLPTDITVPVRSTLDLNTSEMKRIKSQCHASMFRMFKHYEENAEKLHDFSKVNDAQLRLLKEKEQNIEELSQQKKALQQQLVHSKQFYAKSLQENEQESRNLRAENAALQHKKENLERLCKQLRQQYQQDVRGDMSNLRKRVQEQSGLISQLETQKNEAEEEAQRRKKQATRRESSLSTALNDRNDPDVVLQGMASKRLREDRDSPGTNASKRLARLSAEPRRPEAIYTPNNAKGQGQGVASWIQATVTERIEARQQEYDLLFQSAPSF